MFHSKALCKNLVIVISAGKGWINTDTMAGTPCLLQPPNFKVSISIKMVPGVQA
jgi:hypothetical protein